MQADPWILDLNGRRISKETLQEFWDRYDKNHGDLERESRDTEESQKNDICKIYEAFRDRVRLATDLYYRAGSTLFLDTDYGELGRIIERRISFRTSIFFLALILGVIACILLGTPHKMHVYFLGGATLIFLLLKGLARLITFGGLHRKKRTAEQYFSEVIHKFNVSWSPVYNFCAFLDSVRPFSLRQIWFWTLVVGLVLTTINDFGYASITSMSSESLTEFADDFLRYLIIAIIAYIATNVIRELFQVREKYAQSVKEIKETTENGTEAVRRALTIADGIGPLVELDALAPTLVATEFARKNGFVGSVHTFNKRIGEYVSSLTSMIKKVTNKKNPGVDHSISRMAITVTVSEMLREKVEKLSRETSLLTTFANLGGITAELLKNTVGMIGQREDSGHLECYALQIKPPMKFVNYPFINGASEDEKKEWLNYINTNLEYMRREFDIYRYFVSIDSNSLGSDTVCSVRELSELGADNLGYLGWPVFIVDKTRIHEEGLKAERLIENLRIEDVDKDARGEIKVDRANYSVADVLGSVIHQEGHCFVREFDADEIKRLLLVSGERRRIEGKKPLDYFAFRVKVAGESGGSIGPNSRDGVPKREYSPEQRYDWVFCLETIYDEDLDVADIKILFKDGERTPEEKNPSAATSRADENNQVGKLIWQSCATCEHILYKSPVECLNNCWDGKREDTVERKLNEVFFRFPLKNRKLKLNEIFFGHPLFCERIRETNEGGARVRLTNGMDVGVNWVDDENQMENPFPMNDVITLSKARKAKISDILQYGNKTAA